MTNIASKFASPDIQIQSYQKAASLLSLNVEDGSLMRKGIRLKALKVEWKVNLAGGGGRQGRICEWGNSYDGINSSSTPRRSLSRKGSQNTAKHSTLSHMLSSSAFNFAPRTTVGRRILSSIRSYITRALLSIDIDVADSKARYLRQKCGRLYTRSFSRRKYIYSKCTPRVSHWHGVTLKP